MSKLEEFNDELRFAVVNAKKPIVWIDAFDYGYISTIVRSFSANIGVWEWRCSDGNVRDLIKGKIQPLHCDGEGGYYDLSSTIGIFLHPKIKSVSILIAQIYESMFEQDYLLLSTLRDSINTKDKTIILVSPNHIEISGLEHICERFSLPLPDIEDIDEELGFINTNSIIRDKEKKVIGFGDKNLKKVTEVVEQDKEKGYIMKDNTKGLVCRDKQKRIIDMVYDDYKKLKYPFNKDFFDNEVVFLTHYQELVDSLCGMHIYDIQEFLNTLLAKGEANDIQYEYDDGECLLNIIRERKKQIAINSGLLEIIDYDEDQCNKVADIDTLKEYIENEKDRIDNPNKYPPKLSKPKGILLVGAPGCGKSESAKAIASMLKKPLYRLDIGKLLGHKYGQSENRFIEALHTADASAPCVLWIDEIEKAFAGAGNESENDDTLTHIVGYFLTWMQEHPTMVYLVATANDLSRMKPEMLRKGRWDETFYLNYPSEKGCESILKTILEKKFEIVLKENGTDNIQTLAKVMSRIPMSGAEIENVIVETVKYKSEYCKERNTWCINDYDIAYVLLKCLKEKKLYEEKLSKLTREELKEKEPKDRFEFLNNYKNLTDNIVENKDPFLAKKINDEILEISISNFGRFNKKKDEPKLRELLEDKYKGQYNFTPASKFY